MKAIAAVALMLAATNALADAHCVSDIRQAGPDGSFCHGSTRPDNLGSAAPVAPDPMIQQAATGVAGSIGGALGAGLVQPLPPMPERKPLKPVVNDSLTDDTAGDGQIHQGVSAAQDILGEFGTPAPASPAPPKPRPVVPKTPTRRKRGIGADRIPADGKTLGPKYENAPSAQTPADATGNADGGSAISGDGGHPIEGPGVRQGAPDAPPKPNKVGGSGSAGTASTGGSGANPPAKGGSPSPAPPPAPRPGAGLSAPDRKKVALFFDLDDDAKAEKVDCGSVDEKGMLRARMLKAHADDMIERKAAVEKAAAADKSWCAENLQDLAMEDADFDWSGFPKNMIVLLEHERRWDDRCGGPAAAFSREKTQLRRYILTACPGGAVAPEKAPAPEPGK